MSSASHVNRPRGFLILAAMFVAVTPAVAGDTAAEIRMHVDAGEAARRILHGRLEIPARPGPLRLAYPKWLPGEHGPTGPVGDIAGLRISKNGVSLDWKRDPLEMYAFEVRVPEGAGPLEVELDFLSAPKSSGFTAGAFATERMIAISWNHLLLMPEDSAPDRRMVRPSIRLPDGWSYGTALKTASEGAGEVTFEPVSLSRLVDSPLIAGRHFLSVPLSQSGGATVRMDVVADSASALKVPPERIEKLKRLVAEADALFGARHFEDYVFLLSLSDHISHFGLEHHDSSDNRSRERSLVDEDRFRVMAGLLPHEIVHSWNGKYRRPAGMVTESFLEPMKTELLWVYEGLTTYLGDLLTARSGLWTPEVYRENLALDGAGLANRKGRTWRPLVDTAVASQIVFGSANEWGNWRRRADFYSEGALIWLEADVLIRSKTKGKRSLDDFCRLFHGGTSGPPEVRPYTFESITTALGEIVEHDWDAFFRERIDRTTTGPPMGGVDGAGWKLVFSTERGELLKSNEEVRERTDLSHSIGLSLDKAGVISDIVPDSPGSRAGLAPGMKLVAVNGRKYSSKLLRTAIEFTPEADRPLELLVENAEFFRSFRVDYDGGERYPTLERAPRRDDLLSEIIAPKTSRK